MLRVLYVVILTFYIHTNSSGLKQEKNHNLNHNINHNYNLSRLIFRLIINKENI